MTELCAKDICVNEGVYEKPDLANLHHKTYRPQIDGDESAIRRAVELIAGDTRAVVGLNGANVEVFAGAKIVDRPLQNDLKVSIDRERFDDFAAANQIDSRQRCLRDDVNEDLVAQSFARRHRYHRAHPVFSECRPQQDAWTVRRIDAPLSKCSEHALARFLFAQDCRESACWGL